VKSGQGGVTGVGEGLRIHLLAGERFDAGHTFGCGQIFGWREHPGGWRGPFGRSALEVRTVGDRLSVSAIGEPVADQEISRFLGLDRSLVAVESALAADPWLALALAAVPGLRILRQDPWQCLVGFLCSQWNNVPRIEGLVERIARRWGQVLTWPSGAETPVLPAPERLAEVGEAPLREIGLGYRARYVAATARLLAREHDLLTSLRGRPYAEALAGISRLPGVGRKVADCILLFSLDQPGACPVDVWVRRVFHELYARELSAYLPDALERAEQPLSTREHQALVRFASDRWGENAGYAQQYLFHARRTHALAV
jgi:N-glycosylase/DNA lyase